MTWHSGWEEWFAWHPVRTYTIGGKLKWTWLKPVRRARMNGGGGWIYYPQIVRGTR